MANKDLFKQAIAEAKSVREAAIANAKEALEETLTPHLKDMLAAKLQEMEDKSVEEEVENVTEEEEIEETTEVTENEETVEEDLTVAPEMAEAEEEEEAEDDSEESEDEVEDEIEDAGEEAGDEEAVDGDEDLGDLTVDQFKDMIRDIIAQEMGGGGEEEIGMDMDGGDIEGMGDEAPIEEPAMEVPGEEEDDEEINLDELLAELEATVAEGEKEEKDEAVDEAEEVDEDTVEEVSTANSTEVQDTADSQAQGTNINRVVNEELEEALETIEQLKKDLHETNLLNSKLLYVNKIFKANNLTESQKVNVIAAFDKAETVKEVKLVFETVSENVVTKKESVSESKVKGMASKATGTTAAKPEVINEVSDAVRRMQKLAGIIK